MLFDSLLIYAYGGPESMTEIPDFIRNVTGGRISPERFAEVSSHYALFDGVSPMNGAIRQFMNLWKTDYPEIPVYFGARFTEPALKKTLVQMVSDGRKNALVLIPAPFAGYQTAYYEKLEEVCKELDFCPDLTFIPPFSANPLFLKAQESAISETLAGPRKAEHTVSRTVLLCSVHSLPVSLAQRSGYEAAVHVAFETIKDRFPQVESFLAWQSAVPGPIPWLGPQTMEVVKEIARKFGAETRVLLNPLGFPFENMEVAFDLDTEVKNLTESLGMTVLRVPTIGLRREFREMVYSFTGFLS